MYTCVLRFGGWQTVTVKVTDDAEEAAKEEARREKQRQQESIGVLLYT
jgi:hypothetical protein